MPNTGLGLRAHLSDPQEVKSFCYQRALAILQENCNNKEAFNQVEQALCSLASHWGVVMADQQREAIYHNSYRFCFIEDEDTGVLCNIFAYSVTENNQPDELVLYPQQLQKDGKLCIGGQIELTVSSDGKVLGAIEKDEADRRRDTIELQWGETPFDRLTRRELQRHCQRLYAATTCLVSQMEQLQHYLNQPNQKYWKTGSGAIAVEKGQQAMMEIHRYLDVVQIEEVFFKYANDLLFHDRESLKLTLGWATCPICHHKAHASKDGESVIGKTCATVLNRPWCPGTLRGLRWSDFQPEHKPA